MRRARKIVELASTKTECAKEWLLRDERGVHEKDAQKWLGLTAAKAEDLEMSEAQVDEEIAVQIALGAVEAMKKNSEAGL